jgi:hypothetical protein
MRAWNNLYSLVAKHIKNPQLREVMSFHPLLIGGNPFSNKSNIRIAETTDAHSSCGQPLILTSPWSHRSHPAPSQAGQRINTGSASVPLSMHLVVQ